jgi:hypothetical protein
MNKYIHHGAHGEHGVKAFCLISFPVNPVFPVVKLRFF